MRNFLTLIIMISMTRVSSRILWQSGKMFQQNSRECSFISVQNRKEFLFLPSISLPKTKTKVPDFGWNNQLSSTLSRNLYHSKFYATSVEREDNEREKKDGINNMLSEMNFNNVEVPTFDNIKFTEDDMNNMEASEYEEEEISDDDDDDSGADRKFPKKGKKRIKAIRQHVNPLSAYYQLPIELDEDWIQKAYKDPTLPFHIDIGCARGQFCIGMALLNRNINYLGLEIRRPCVNEANLKLHEKKSTDLTNVHFLASNANIDLETIVQDIQKVANSHVETISIQFPDPHFKKKHRKRRVVQPGLVETIGKTLAFTKPGSNENTNKLFIQSDVLDVIEEMRYAFRNSTILKDTVDDFEEWLPSNPMDVLTEREKLVLRQNLPVYRTIFKVDNSRGNH